MRKKKEVEDGHNVPSSRTLRTTESMLVAIRCFEDEEIRTLFGNWWMRLIRKLDLNCNTAETFPGNY